MNTIIEGIVTIIIGVISVFLIPWLKQKVGEAKWKKIQEITEYAVRYAEQKYTPDQWMEKKNFVLCYILEQSEKMNIDMTESDLDILVEGIVNLVKHDPSQGGNGE